MPKMDTTILIIFLSVVLLMVFYIVYLKADVSKVKASLAQADNIIATQDWAVKALEKRNLRLDKTITEWSFEREKITKDNKKLRREVEAARNESPDFKYWGDTALPNQLKPGGGLRPKREASSDSSDNQTDTPDSVD